MTDDYEYQGSAVIFSFKGKRFGTEFTVLCNESGYLVTNEKLHEDFEYPTLAEMQKVFPEMAEKVSKRMNGEIIT